MMSTARRTTADRHPPLPCYAPGSVQYRPCTVLRPAAPVAAARTPAAMPRLGLPKAGLVQDRITPAIFLGNRARASSATMPPMLCPSSIARWGATWSMRRSSDWQAPRRCTAPPTHFVHSLACPRRSLGSRHVREHPVGASSTPWHHRCHAGEIPSPAVAAARVGWDRFAHPSRSSATEITENPTRFRSSLICVVKLLDLPQFAQQFTFFDDGFLVQCNGAAS
jgi:hypothetical protein